MRTTNLIQSYVNKTPISQQYNSDKAVKDFDVNKELSNRTFIKPLPSNGKLLKPTIFEIPSNWAKDIKYDWKALGHAIKGEANDHELGRLNDVAMKTGGLAIASYLFTKKSTPMTKWFEFIGLASFFGAMNLWPKLFIQLPAWLLHGVNVRQEYEDSFGRKKMFYQDHQFIPWDLYSDKEINKIGDRLRVPKDIPNRREFIQEKMRKIALQNNTLWMLTAGFATPIMSALICNGLEKPIANYLDSRTDKKANSLLTNFSNEIKRYDFSENTKALEEMLAENSGKPITPELFEALHANLSEGLDHLVSTGLRKDLEQLLPTNNKFNVTEDVLKDVHELLKDMFKGIPEAELEKILPDGESIVNAFSAKNFVNADFKDFSEPSKVIQNLLQDNIDKYLEENPTSPIAKKLEFLAKKLVHTTGSEHGIEAPLMQVLKQRPSAILTDELANSLKGISSTLNTLKAESLVLDRFTFMKVAQAPETGLANTWNKTTEAFLKIMNFTPEEIRQGRLDGEIANKILRNKLEAITADEKSYSTFVANIEKFLSELHSQMASLDMTQDESINLYKSLVNSSYDSAANELRNSNMSRTVEALVGFGHTSKTSAKEMMLEFVTSRFEGVKYTFYRMLNTADLFYKVSHVEGLDHVLTPQMLRETKEEIVELGKNILLGGHTSDYSVKFWQKRHANPNTSDYSQIEVAGGKVLNKYQGKAPETELIEFSNDKDYFDRVMKFMFGGDIHSSTDNKIKNAVFYEDFKNYRKKVLDFLGGDYYFAKPNFLVDGKRVDSSSLFKFQLNGCALDELFLKLFNNSYNSQKWFSTFGKLGAGLAGVTLLSQFFIGYMKNPKVTKEVK